MQRLMRIMLWRPHQSAALRWVEAALLFAAAITARLYLGQLRGGNPGLTFVPAIALATMLLGWQQGTFVLLLSVAAGWSFIVPPGMELMPAVWLVIGGLTIALLASFRAMAHELAAANERQRILFQVARQRVAQGAQPELGILETPAARLSPARAEAVKILADAARRIAGSPDMQSRLRNSASLRRELDAILRDAVTSIIDRRTVSLAFDVEELDLTFDLMSSITMLVIELANEAQKHVFQPGRGSCFSVALKAVPGDRATLTVTDDGPVKPATAGSTAPEERGLEIVHALVAQMHGTLRTRFVRGAEFAIEFPLGR